MICGLESYGFFKEGEALDFIQDGRIELDNNCVERAMRPVCLSRKNSLFAGSDGGGANWACLASLIETCKLNGRGIA